MEWLAKIAVDNAPLLENMLKYIARIIGFVGTGLSAYTVILKYISKKCKFCGFSTVVR